MSEASLYCLLCFALLCFALHHQFLHSSMSQRPAKITGVGRVGSPSYNILAFAQTVSRANQTNPMHES
jgi:hypothetical protein